MRSNRFLDKFIYDGRQEEFKEYVNDFLLSGETEFSFNGLRYAFYKKCNRNSKIDNILCVDEKKRVK